MRDELLIQAKRLVIKVGSSLVASRETGLSSDKIERLAAEIVRGDEKDSGQCGMPKVPLYSVT